MRKTIFVTGIFVVLLLSGCATQFVCQDGRTVSNPSMCTAKTSEKTTEKPATNIPSSQPQQQTQQPVTKEIDPEIQKLFDKAKNITNYEYDYTAPKNEFVGQVMVLGNNMKIVFTKGPQVYMGYKYDTVYFELAKKTAVAMCTTLGDCENMTAAKQEDYDRVYVGTIQDVIDQVIYAKETGEEMLDNRNCKVVNYKLLNGETGRMWIEKWYGVPLKRLYTMEDQQVSATYFSFSKDSVKEVEVKVLEKAEFV